MTKKFSLFILTFLFLGSVALAQENITYPIGELGDCTSKEECKTYCDDVSHIEACVSFGEMHGLMRKDEVNRAREALGELKERVQKRSEFQTKRPNVRAPEGPEDEAVDKLLQEKSGPVGCDTKDKCHEYCEQEANMDECFKFATENKLMSEEQIEQAKKFKNKTGGGGCNGPACRTYCENEEHAQECIVFAEENGFISKEEAEKAKKFIGKIGPGGCKMEECKTYCEDPSHMEECMAFALENGFITAEEAERAKNLRRTLEETSGPGGCKGEECRTYCDDSEHLENCKKFAEEHGFGRPEMMEPPKEMGREGMNNPPCSTPEECKKMYEDRGERTEREFQDQEYKGSEESRDTEGKIPFPGRRPMPEGFQTTPEQQKLYDEYKRDYDQTPDGAPDDVSSQKYPPRMPLPPTFVKPPFDAIPPISGEYQQFQQQYDQQYQQQSGEFSPPEGSFTPPTSGTYMPDGGSYQLPSTDQQPPTVYP